MLFFGLAKNEDVLNALGALEALGSDALGVQDSTRYFWGLLGFGLWL